MQKVVIDFVIQKAHNTPLATVVSQARGGKYGVFALYSRETHCMPFWLGGQLSKAHYFMLEMIANT